MKTIFADTGCIAGRLDRSFNTCVSASRAYLLLRNDHMQHLKTVHDECGFRYVRFHGLLQDDMGIYRIDKSVRPIYSWQYCDAVYDHILDIGMKPFVVFDFMPSALASGKNDLLGTFQHHPAVLVRRVVQFDLPHHKALYRSLRRRGSADVVL